MLNTLIQFSRIFVGCLFIFSGLIKANDPVGFAVKLDDYFLVFSETLPFFKSDFVRSTALLQASLIVVFEVALGIALLLGIYIRQVAILLLLMILFFTWLTGYSAVTGTVQDCGCFGDAIPLTPWQSFYKDLILLFFIGIIFIYKDRIKGSLPSGISYSLALIGIILTSWITVRSIQHNPFIDFRPYKVGNNIRELMEVPDDAPQAKIQIKWTYKNKESGVEEIFYDDDYPTDSDKWEFVKREDKVIDPGFEPEINDFIFADARGEMAADYILQNPDYNFYIISPDLDKTRVSAFEKINEIQVQAEMEGIEVIGMVAAGNDKIDAFRHSVQAAYPFYSGDEKGLKTMIRTNPGIMLIKDATVIAKWSWRDLPDYQSIKQEYFPDRVAVKKRESSRGIFEAGDNILNLMAEGVEPFNEFFIMDKESNDLTDSLLKDTSLIHIITVADIFSLDQEAFDEVKQYMQGLELGRQSYFILSGSDEDGTLQMRKASGIDFDYYFADGEMLEKIGLSNTAVVQIKHGVVQKKMKQGEIRQ